MGRRIVFAWVLAVAACRGEPAPASPSPAPSKAAEPAKADPPDAKQPVEEASRTSKPDDDPPPEPSPDPPPTGPALDAAAVPADLHKRWPAFSAANLADNQSRKTLDSLVTDGKPSVTSTPCAEAAKTAKSRLDNGNDLLYGDVPTVAAHAGNCWAIHIPGLMGPTLELVLRPDGEIMLAVMILEG